MSLSLASGLLGGLISIAVCTYISAIARESKIEGNLRFGTFIITLAWGCFAIFLYSIWAAFNATNFPKGSNNLLSIITLFVGFGLATIYCFGEYFKVCGTFNSKIIEFHTPWTGKKEERWDSLEAVEYNSVANWYLLRFNSGQKIRLSKLLKGHGQVLDAIRVKGFDI